KKGCGHRRVGSYTIVRAPELMSTVGPFMLIVAPWPLVMVIPTSLTEIFAPEGVWRRMPPAEPGTSLMTIPFCWVVWNVMPLTAGGTVWASCGTCEFEPQKQPTQMGKSGSPCSNSTQTAEPTGGTVNIPMFVPATVS